MRRITALPALLLLAGTVWINPLSAQPSREAGRQALSAVQAQRWSEAQSAAAAADPLVAKMVTWSRLSQRGGAASAGEIVAFIETAADWPGQDSLSRRAEELLAADPDDALALRFFNGRPARTLDGATRHVAALLNAGRQAEARSAAARAWGDDTGSDAFAETTFLERAGSLLTPDDHWRRFNRFSFGRDFAAGQRLLPLLDPGRQPLAQLRLAYAAGGGTDPDPAAAARDAGATLERARMLRRAERDGDAAAAWAAGAASQVGLPAEAQRAIWTERQVLARKLIRLGDPRTAYVVAAQNGQTIAGEPRQEAEFLAGFIALRLLDDPARALPHFQRLAEGSRSAITQARAAYWQGRAERDPARAAAHFQRAAGFPVAFYGQMGSIALGESGAQLSSRILNLAVPRPTDAEARAFLGRELPRLVMTLGEMGEAGRSRPFLLRLEETAAHNGERLLIARLATVIGRPDFAVWVARRGGAQGAMLVEDGWPAPYAAPEGHAEPAVVFAITRQESNFQVDAVSSASARGLMQLMPATAQSVARRIGIPHQLGWLTTDPTHNIRLGSFYIQDRLDSFGGVMAFAAAAYNAGGGRVTEWIGTFGDPRSGQIRMLDWMELIPFSETRNYVQRVIENVAVYRAKNPATSSLEHPMAAWAR
ncbi:lytic transglycosylase domain-containing protein [Roseococcus sp. SYP-B2431]|uniref:lytic transglycosylase domain-containing protein n=1 Tax=Roseococcus sp. SYP-B2431 TaxID=2496640 RepID=UPI001039FA55|nr:lytic transglycosylase domain-containing protein [Roseococcus sp. SYP-B2431]TCH96436.1 lytic transglycosylase domain-containing protein [Roseococcus sp. SYP-B2431]